MEGNPNILVCFCINLFINSDLRDVDLKITYCTWFILCLINVPLPYLCFTLCLIPRKKLKILFFN